MTGVSVFIPFTVLNHLFLNCQHYCLGMDLADQVRLARNRKEIRETVVFKYIAAFLLQDGVINSEEFQLVAINQTKQSQMDTLMDLLPSKGHEAFLSFISSLDEDYPWLAQNLRKSVSAQDISSYQHNIQNKMCSNDENDNNLINNNCPTEKKGNNHQQLTLPLFLLLVVIFVQNIVILFFIFLIIRNHN